MRLLFLNQYTSNPIFGEPMRRTTLLTLLIVFSATLNYETLALAGAEVLPTALRATLRRLTPAGTYRPLTSS
jgi:hypothetical protein